MGLKHQGKNSKVKIQTNKQTHIGEATVNLRTVQGSRSGIQKQERKEIDDGW